LRARPFFAERIEDFRSREVLGDRLDYIVIVSVRLSAGNAGAVD
jgi:hypothetical protein